ncbi:hypothetical protein Lste_0801 [Legionella steelei]|uniref:Uncharacterized protein n=1 Tax=Legionella steelei TaxID=947033 RepID=A0A0W0ZLQ1_9GAMM|nr:hypothetical protein [Legionella steelei]KTD70197.1 hypothetical protein Lste_0801 [Legionella steelei]
MIEKHSFFPYLKKQKYVVIFNYIHYDGIGDFNHLLDFAKEFTPQAEKLGIKIILLVVSTAHREKLVKQRLQTILPALKAHVLELGESSGDKAIQEFSNFIQNNLELKSELSTTCSIFQISTSMAKAQKDAILSFCPSEIPVITIPEITGLRTSALNLPLSHIDPRDEMTQIDLKTQNINTRYLGLQKVPYQYGLKIRSHCLLSLMALENRNFFKHVTGLNDSAPITPEDISKMLAKTQLVPAYLQDWDSINRFLSFCIQRFQISNQEHLVIYLNNIRHNNRTGVFSVVPHILLDAEEILFLEENQFDDLIIKRKNKQYLPFMEEQLIFGSLFLFARNSNISAIEINVNGNIRRINYSPTTICNPPKVVSILTDFNLNDTDYDLLIENASDIVGVSGDNTIEKALSYNKLPFLQPNNKENFESVMRLLGHLAKLYLPIDTPNLHKDFEAFFCNKMMRLDKPECFTNLLEIDIRSLYKVWPAVVEGLRQNYNIFNQIHAIFYEPLLHYSAQTGDIALLHLIHNHFEDINFNIPNKQDETALTIAEKNNHRLFIKELQSLMQKKEESKDLRISNKNCLSNNVG